MNKKQKEWLKDICKICKHERGRHNDVGHCSGCYDQYLKDSTDIPDHEFVLGVKNG